MSTPLSPTQILAAAQGSGLAVYEMPGWRGKCRCHNGNHEQGIAPTGRGWGPTNGVTVHLTTGAANSGQAAINYAAGILTQGRADTPGPLVQFSIDADGRAIIIAAGRSNHAGAIGSAGLAAMVAENFSLAGSQNLRGHDVDGNTHTVGIEIQTPVTPSQVQHDAAAKLCAAICRAYGWTGQEVHGHGEVSDQRGFSDPNMNMGEFRRTVISLVAHGTPPTSSTAPTITQEDNMPIFMRCTDSRVFLLIPGQPLRHLEPHEWDLWQVLGATLRGGDFLAADITILDATLQPGVV